MCSTGAHAAGRASQGGAIPRALGLIWACAKQLWAGLCFGHSPWGFRALGRAQDLYCSANRAHTWHVGKFISQAWNSVYGGNVLGKRSSRIRDSNNFVQNVPFQLAANKEYVHGPVLINEIPGLDEHKITFFCIGLPSLFKANSTLATSWRLCLLLVEKSSDMRSSVFVRQILQKSIPIRTVLDLAIKSAWTSFIFRLATPAHIKRPRGVRLKTQFQFIVWSSELKAE